MGGRERDREREAFGRPFKKKKYYMLCVWASLLLSSYITRLLPSGYHRNQAEGIRYGNGCTWHLEIDQHRNLIGAPFQHSLSPTLLPHSTRHTHALSIDYDEAVVWVRFDIYNVWNYSFPGGNQSNTFFPPFFVLLVWLLFIPLLNIGLWIRIGWIMIVNFNSCCFVNLLGVSFQ